jgi:hypothetical protein
MNSKEEFEQVVRAMSFMKPEELLVLMKRDSKSGKQDEGKMYI